MSGPSEKLPPDLSEAFGDLFGQFFAGAFSANLAVDLALTDAEAASGVTREIAFQRESACTTCEGRGTRSPEVVPDPCKTCNATGKQTSTQGFFEVQTICAACKGAGRTITDPCATCTGSGRVASEAKVSVVVPANVEHATGMTLEGEGNIGNDGTAGVLYVYILVGGRPDPRMAEISAVMTAHGGSLPGAQIHRPPMPTWQVALIGIIALGLLAALLLVR